MHLMKYQDSSSSQPVFCVHPYQNMSKSIVIGAGVGIGRANGGGGYNTGGPQGGGNKKQGLVGTTNMRVELVPYVRTRADGGNSRNWVFCMNQLGGVGRRWGQAAGPGNRGGVHTICKTQAANSRAAHPKRPKQFSGWGQTLKHRANMRGVQDIFTVCECRPGGQGSKCDCKDDPDMEAGQCARDAAAGKCDVAGAEGDFMRLHCMKTCSVCPGVNECGGQPADFCKDLVAPNTICRTRPNYSQATWLDQTLLPPATCPGTGVCTSSWRA